MYTSFHRRCVFVGKSSGSHTWYPANSPFSIGHYTFTPALLCQMDTIKPDINLANLMAKAHRLIGLLEGSCRHIENIENINRLFKIKEAAASCRIDDKVKFTYLEIFGIFKDKRRAKRIAAVNNHLEALEYGVNSLQTNSLTNELIYSTHSILMKHRTDVEVGGAIRAKQNFIGDIMVSVGGMKMYNPPTPEKVASCMNDLDEYINRNDTIDPLIKTALLHYQLEVIHPFDSGNGKIG